MLWLQSEPDRLGSHLDLVEDPTNALYVSVAVGWEIVIKRKTGRLPPEVPPPAEWLPDRIVRMGAASIPIAHNHVFRLAVLPDLHRDPFDRIMVAQALEQDLIILTADKMVARYPVSSILV